MPTPVKWYSSSQTGAPVLSGTAGALISVLDSCLVTGFGLQAVSTLVVAAGVATITMPDTPTAVANSVILVAGATPAGLNGEQRVLATTSNTITFATTEANTTATGTITVKMAPAGWAKEFTGTNLAAYRSADVTGTRLRLKVDDTLALYARVTGYELLTDIATGVIPFPDATQLSGGLYWHKSSTSDATARPWYLVADSRTLYLYLAPNATYNDHGYTYSFGDINSVRPGEAYACWLLGHETTTNYNSISTSDVATGETQINTGAYIARSFTALGGSQKCHKTSAFNTQNLIPSGYATYSGIDLTYPNAPDNGLITSRVQVLSSSALRGSLPGVLHTPQDCQSTFNTGNTITGAGSYSGRTLLALRSGGALGYAKNTLTYGAGVIFIDLTGPWR
ncbi:MAG: hypothetical protein JZU64_06840 [Rhodoferax sp.]|nr:hypothetical protein [Rhodoferax sp.]